jgi:UDP-glucose 4-epimerase
VKVFVTGACGQVGSHVIEMLLARGDDIVGIDNLATGRREHLVEHPRLRVVLGSISDRELVNQIVAELKPDALVHTAASYKDPEDWYTIL